MDYKTSHKQHGICVAIANNTLFGSKLSIFLLYAKIIRILSKDQFHEDIL